MYCDEVPICPLCEKPMTDHSKPQQPFYVCEECQCDDSGIEVAYCESCGEYYDLFDGDCDCGIDDDEEKGE